MSTTIVPIITLILIVGIVMPAFSNIGGIKFVTIHISAGNKRVMRLRKNSRKISKMFSSLLEFHRFYLSTGFCER